MSKHLINPISDISPEQAANELIKVQKIITNSANNEISNICIGEAHDWGAQMKRLEVGISSGHNLIGKNRENLAEIINVLATVERTIDALGWLSKQYPGSIVNICHPSTSDNTDDTDIVLNDKMGNIIALCEVTDIVKKVANQNNKEIKSIEKLGWTAASPVDEIDRYIVTSPEHESALISAGRKWEEKNYRYCRFYTCGTTMMLKIVSSGVVLHAKNKVVPDADIYHHSTKAGNQGDLVKHFSLVTLLHHMSIDHEGWNYIDVHSGEADYQIPPDSSSILAGVGNFEAILREHGSEHSSFTYFYNFMGLGCMREQNFYPGSSRIVQKMMASRQIREYHFVLCDVDPGGYVCQSLRKSYEKEVAEKQIVVIHGDGYREAKQKVGMDFMLIDPPEIRSDGGKEFITLIEYCISQDISFLSWNPLVGNDTGDGMSPECQNVVEAAYRHSIPMFTVRWTDEWTEAMCGCQLMIQGKGAEDVVQQCLQLVVMMGWQHTVINTDTVAL
jgi:23S rRNA A2030 N6-methylase RlmJ